VVPTEAGNPSRQTEPAARAGGTVAFTFTGTLHSVALDVSGELIRDPEAELRLHLARQ
jgi:hypothetical protein